MLASPSRLTLGLFALLFFSLVSTATWSFGFARPLRLSNDDFELEEYTSEAEVATMGRGGNDTPLRVLRLLKFKIDAVTPVVTSAGSRIDLVTGLTELNIVNTAIYKAARAVLYIPTGPLIEETFDAAEFGKAQELAPLVLGIMSDVVDIIAILGNVLILGPSFAGTDLPVVNLLNALAPFVEGLNTEIVTLLRTGQEELAGRLAQLGKGLTGEVLGLPRASSWTS